MVGLPLSTRRGLCPTTGPSRAGNAIVWLIERKRQNGLQSGLLDLQRPRERMRARQLERTLPQALLLQFERGRVR